MLTIFHLGSNYSWENWCKLWLQVQGLLNEDTLKQYFGFYPARLPYEFVKSGIRNPVLLLFLFSYRRRGVLTQNTKIGVRSGFRHARICVSLFVAILGKMSANKFAFSCLMAADLSFIFKKGINVMLFFSSFFICHCFYITRCSTFEILMPVVSVFVTGFTFSFKTLQINAVLCVPLSFFKFGGLIKC